MSAAGETRVYGIRHHGPGSARSLRNALAEFRPDTVLIEGPADANPLVAPIAAATMEPPVALLGYVAGDPARAAFWPYAEFSPEWQAMSYAVAAGIPARFCDLPAAVALAVDDAPGERDVLTELAAAGGYDDPERWWDAVVESNTDAAIFPAVTEAMAALRATALREPAAGNPASDEPQPLILDRHTLVREAHMRQVLRRTRKDGARRIAVVCGAWHAPALCDPLGPANADQRLLTGLPRVSAKLTWIPWTHSRLAAASGYGAGVGSPGWYHHVFVDTEHPVASWLTRVARLLRAHDLPVSSAHVIEGVRLAETLAALRCRPSAGLSEVTEATRAVLCAGDETMLRLVINELVVGEALGTVPADTPTVPLAADLSARARSLRLKQEPTSRTLDLDLRKERDIAVSRLLHRLRLLDVHWGTPTTGTTGSTGTFRETWTLRWEPEFAVRVIDAARWGTTVQGAAEAKIVDTADRNGSGVAELADALEFALLAELPGALGGLIDRLGSAAAVDQDITRLLTALPGVLRTLRYGDVRGTGTPALARVADSMLVRICAGLPAAVTGLGAEAAAAVRARLDEVNTAIHTRDDTRSTRRWLATLAHLADRPDLHGALAGRLVRMLCDAARFDAEEAARRLAAALSIGTPATEKAAWIEGFVGGRGLVLVHDRPLLRLVDTWLAGLGEEQFTTVLPLLRRTFGAFAEGERRALGAAVRKPGPVAAAVHPETDPQRGARALRAVADLLGVPV